MGPISSICSCLIIKYRISNQKSQQNLKKRNFCKKFFLQLFLLIYETDWVSPLLQPCRRGDYWNIVLALYKLSQMEVEPASCLRTVSQHLFL